jgi:hypothetical protein
MKRRALVLALFAGLLLPGLVPGMALAIATPTYLDQSSTTISSDVSGKFAQTFTAGQSGPLSRVDLLMASLNNPGGDSLSVSIYPTDGAGKPVTTGTALATSGSAAVPYSATTGSWISFSFASPYSVTAGTMYAIAFTTNGGLVAVFAWGSDSDAYAGGAAWVANPSWSHQTAPVDFDFRTYLEDSITTTVVWDKSQVAAGTATALKLTVTIAFGNGAEANNYIVLLGDLPSWYVNPTPPSIVCSWGACTLATIQGVAGVTVTASNPGSTLTVTLQGTANPVVADEGTPGTALGNGCIAFVESSLCSDATGSVAVVAPGASPAPTRAATPPPTSASAVPASDHNGISWLLSFALLASIGGLLVLVDRKRRRGI